MNEQGAPGQTQTQKESLQEGGSEDRQAVRNAEKFSEDQVSG